VPQAGPVMGLPASDLRWASVLVTTANRIGSAEVDDGGGEPRLFGSPGDKV
jgi:hypothetical protein